MEEIPNLTDIDSSIHEDSEATASRSTSPASSSASATTTRRLTTVLALPARIDPTSFLWLLLQFLWSLIRLETRVRQQQQQKQKQSKNQDEEEEEEEDETTTPSPNIPDNDSPRSPPTEETTNIMDELPPSVPTSPTKTKDVSWGMLSIL